MGLPAHKSFLASAQAMLMQHSTAPSLWKFLHDRQQ